jgi:Phage Mu protein F like protein
MYEEYNKLTLAEQKKLLREIDRLYRIETDRVKAEIEKILADKGKSQRDKIKALGVILGGLWWEISDHILADSMRIMKHAWTVYGTNAPNPLLLDDKDISQLIGRTVKKRTDIIKWNRLIRANSRVLDKRVSSIVKKGLANSKTARQIQAELEKTMMMNRGKAKAIARTETNFYKSESKMQVGLRQEKNGQVVVKTWVYTHLSKEPRESHLHASGQMVEGIDTYFQIGDYKTKAPQHFGLASQDINCDMRMEFKK